jgi:hypothetical protein
MGYDASSVQSGDQLAAKPELDRGVHEVVTNRLQRPPRWAAKNASAAAMNELRFSERREAMPSSG